MKRWLLGLILVATTGCGAERAALDAKAPAAGPAKELPAAPPPADARLEAADKEKDAAVAVDAPPSRDPSMIIYTAKVTMAVYQVDQGLANVERIAREQGGFLALKHDREITIRVPRANFEATLAAIDKLGDVLHRDVSAEDVTAELVDLDIRIKNARALQERLRALLQKAPVKEALDIEKELARVTEELERLEGRQKLLRDKIALSTVTVAFEPRGATLATARPRLPFPFIQQLGLPNLLNLDEQK